MKISFLQHLDPARPRNSRNHDISEMKPSLDQVFSGWHEYLQLLDGQPAILLDLSPRLSNKQMLQVEKLVRIFGQMLARLGLGPLEVEEELTGWHCG